MTISTTQQDQAATTSTQQPQAQAAQQAQDHYLFTLKFPGGEVAVLEVRGAPDQNEARAVAASALPRCRYTVTDGDVSNGHAEYFYDWTCTAAQERDPRVVAKKEAQV